MGDFVTRLNAWLEAVNDILWHDVAMFAVLGVGILFTLWSGFGQFLSLRHGTAVVLGRYTPRGAGAINPFQALSAALSATVGIGNIGGVALAVALGGPGAVFWMWVIGFFGMALKLSEVTLAMLYRNVSESENPHGGAMWVADRGFARFGSGWRPVGKVVAWIFCITLLIATITGGNMFQAWNVAEVTVNNFDISRLTFGIVEWLTFGIVDARLICGIVLAVLCGLVIIGGIKRIGAVAGTLVPFMCGIYMLAGLYILAVHFAEIPSLLRLIVRSAFAPAEASGAFLGGTFGYAFLWGMKRALFSNEAGQGSSPIAHCAVKTDEPVREGVVAGLEPFIDTLVVCTMTSLIILASGAWNRGPEAQLPTTPPLTEVEPGQWTLPRMPVPTREAGTWTRSDTLFVVIRAEENQQTGSNLHRLHGEIVADGNDLAIQWRSHGSDVRPELVDSGIYFDYVGAALTSHAFDRVVPGLGRWMVTLAVWLFALSTVISWNYYGEQGMIYMFGPRSVMPYRVFYCLMIVVACAGLFKTDRELDNISALGTGVMLFANLPICLIFARQTMRAYWDYVARLRAGEFRPNGPIVNGR